MLDGAITISAFTKGDEWKGAIVTNRGLYEPKVMYFKMTKSCNFPSPHELNLC